MFATSNRLYEIVKIYEGQSNLKFRLGKVKTDLNNLYTSINFSGGINLPLINDVSLLFNVGAKCNPIRRVLQTVHTGFEGWAELPSGVYQSLSNMSDGGSGPSGLQDVAWTMIAIMFMKVDKKDKKDGKRVEDNKDKSDKKKPKANKTASLPTHVKQKQTEVVNKIDDIFNQIKKKKKIEKKGPSKQ